LADGQVLQAASGLQFVRLPDGIIADCDGFPGSLFLIS